MKTVFFFQGSQILCFKKLSKSLPIGFRILRIRALDPDKVGMGGEIAYDIHMSHLNDFMLSIVRLSSQVNVLKSINIF